MDGDSLNTENIPLGGTLFVETDRVTYKLTRVTPEFWAFSGGVYDTPLTAMVDGSSYGKGTMLPFELKLGLHLCLYLPRFDSNFTTGPIKSFRISIEPEKVA